MQGAEDRQGDGETQVAQGCDLVEAAGLRDVGLGSPQGNQEKQDAGDLTLPYTYKFHELAEKPESESDQLRDAVLKMMHARMVCHEGRVLDALALYDSISESMTSTALVSERRQ